MKKLTETKKIDWTRSLIGIVMVGITTGCGGTPTTELSVKQTATSETTPNQASNLANSNGAIAQAQTTASSIQQCESFAYVIDKDPKGVNVRSGPSSTSKAIGNLPTNTEEVTVDIVASQKDWVQITKAESTQKVEFQGKGWVYAQLLGTGTRGYGSKGVNLYSAANTKSRILGKIPPSTNVKLLSCKGRWVKVSHQKLTGWLPREAQCATLLTTCS